MQPLRSPFSRRPPLPHFKILLFQKGKQWLVLVALHYSTSLLKFAINKVVGGESRGVSAEQAVDPLEVEGLGLESHVCQWETR